MSGFFNIPAFLFPSSLCFNIAPLCECDQRIFDDIFHVTQLNNTTLSSRDDLTCPPPPPLLTPLTHSLPPILVWGEGGCKGWGRKTHPHTTWQAALVPQLI